MEPRRQRLEGTPYVLIAAGAGAMGESGSARHEPEAPAVIKLIHPRYAAEAQVVARMRRRRASSRTSATTHS